MSKITKSIEKSFECFNNDDSHNNNYYNNNNINNIFNFDSPNFNIINNKNYFFDELNFNSNFFSMDFYQNILLFNKGNNLINIKMIIIIIILFHMKIVKNIIKNFII